MLERLRLLTHDARVQRAVDIGLATCVFLASLADLLRGGDGSGWGGPRAVELLVAFAISVPLLWRRSHPGAALAVVGAAGFGSVLLVAPRQAAFEAFLALILVFYALGAHGDDRHSLRVLVVALVVGFAGGLALVATGNSTAGNALPTVVWAFCAWLVGRIIRSWRGRAAELEAANRVLEEQRELQAEAAVAVERGRIARELHDVIAHNVSMIVVQAGAATRVLKGDQPEVSAALHAIESTGRETVDEMRRLLGVLRHADDGQALAPQPGLASLGALVEQVRAAGLPVELEVKGTPTALPPALDLSAYRIAQEGLTNVLKHAGPARAAVTVTYERDAVEIEIRDDGDGTAGWFGTGNGLIGMRERAALWGGHVRAGRDRGGWVVHASLPLRSQA